MVNGAQMLDQVIVERSGKGIANDSITVLLWEIVKTMK
jgi:hypothetical protein